MSNRRNFIKKAGLGSVAAAITPITPLSKETETAPGKNQKVTEKTSGNRTFNGSYQGANLNRIAFPLGGIGAGMFCLEGTGAISHMSVRHRPDVFHEPGNFAALSVKTKSGIDNTIVLEGQVPEWKKFGQPNSCLGGEKRTA